MRIRKEEHLDAIIKKQLSWNIEEDCGNTPSQEKTKTLKYSSEVSGNEQRMSSYGNY